MQGKEMNFLAHAANFVTRFFRKMKHQNVDWCCYVFYATTEVAGERGFAIFSDTGEFPARVVLQFRAVDSDVEFPPLSFPHPISLGSELTLQYCPWCGKHLQSWYGYRLEWFSRSDLAIRVQYE